MNFEIIFVLGVVILMMIALIKEITRPDMIVFGGVLVIFLVTGILTPEEAVAGFSNQGMLTVALLFIVAGAIQKSGLVDRGMARVLGTPKTEQRTLFRLLVPISGFSAFLNNTPIVVTLTPIIRKWCNEHNISPSKFLIPLSYASILGGILTLMGTSTNLVVHGLMLDRGMEGYSLFTLTMVSLPASLLGLIYLVTMGYKLLPNHKGLTESFSEKSKEYLIEVVIDENYPFLDNPYVGKTVEEAGLRNLEGLYLIEIIRKKEKIYPVKNSTKIKSNDRLIFTGIIDKIAELQNKKGLSIETGTNLTLDKLKNGTGQLVEVVVSHQSSLLHKTIKETQFRSKFDAGVMAVHRNNERINSKIGDISLKPGDTLLLLTGPDFYGRVLSTNDFYVVTPIEEDHPLLNKNDTKRSWFSILALVSMILLVSFDILSMFKAMSVLVILYLVFKIISPDEAKKNIQFNVLLLIASAFGVGEALFKTGAADWVANKLILLADPLGVLGLLIFLYALTAIFTEMITNNAAAVLMFPIALEAANRLSIEPIAFLVLITIAASASFLSPPIGYQTNLIVYGPGGYKFSDYIKVGLPLSLIVMITTIVMVHFIWIS
ncbi:sulfate permease [Gracilibacillus boraciitolerans JCM 21714]|uniref:Sulfate permease n=1 Tax=Gracilibacillus boraciitolerans JCM 21714 TaxID=1298598 RepID=W4VM32_9BACI|nr:SLC13 family permease [Gracilibacillus boraciitolerans]GAE94267.1 sulfate permease [Gracilibacillus boraciitolerans JCM 21714]